MSLTEFKNFIKNKFKRTFWNPFVATQKNHRKSKEGEEKKLFAPTIHLPGFQLYLL